MRDWDSGPAIRSRRGGPAAAALVMAAALALEPTFVWGAGASPGYAIPSARAVPPSPFDQVRLLTTAPISADSSVYSYETRAVDCAGACHIDVLQQWGAAADSDLDIVPVWDETDEQNWQNGTLEALDPYDTQVYGSMHGLAWQDYEFQLVYHGEPAVSQVSCQRCHIPESALEPVDQQQVFAPSTRGINAANAREGITCASCHINGEGQIVGRTEADGTGSVPHEVVASAMFDGSSLCASCHNETLFGALAATVTEWQQQIYGGSPTCVDCHMTDWNSGAILHAAAGGHSNRMRLAAFMIEFPEPVVGGPLQVDVTNVGAGHNAPTGENFRAFELHVTVMEVRTQRVVLDDYLSITTVIRTPIDKEIVWYDQEDAIAAGETRTLEYGTLDPGRYDIAAELVYYQIKPTVLRSVSKPHLSYLEPFGETVVRTWEAELEIEPDADLWEPLSL